MTEAELRDALVQSWNVPRETVEQLGRFARMVLEENQRQNLIARSTEAAIWERHILDSAQLLRHAGAWAQSWLDVGSGAGFPGIVLAIMTNAEHHLVEPRRRRAAFLDGVVRALGLENRVHVVQTTAEKLPPRPFSRITARAVAALTALLDATVHLSDARTIWLLHKGRRAAAEVDEARRSWNATFDLLPSITDEEAAIVRVRGLAGKRSA